MRLLVSSILLMLPLLEIAAFILVGRQVGVLATIGLVLLGGGAGIVLLRVRGLSAFSSAQAALRAGHNPGPHIVNGALALVAAILLLVPGFVSDFIALLLLIPGVRNVIWRAIKSRIATFGRFSVQRTESGARGRAYDGRVIDLDDRDFSRAADPKSPWRPEGGS